MNIDEKSVQKAIKGLENLSRGALPLAVRNTLNDLAFEGREAMQDEIQRKFTNRNKWTKNNVRVNKASGYDIGSMESEAGHTEAYMETQQDGGRVKGKSGRSKPVANTNARTGKSNARLVPKRNIMSNLDAVKGGSRKGSKKANFVAKAVVGKREKKVLIHKDTVYRVGRVSGLKGKKVKIKLIPLYKLQDNGVQIKRTNWKDPADRKVATENNVNKIFLKNAEKAVDRYIK